mmetsp:Transcript_24118/g.41295  ORF Transcript_24118/g.41295 Transcript_24118/m.41295 type:complete len:100 (+) Transcript_24118:131-430(+)
MPRLKQDSMPTVQNHHIHTRIQRTNAFEENQTASQNPNTSEKAKSSITMPPRTPKSTAEVAGATTIPSEAGSGAVTGLIVGKTSNIGLALGLKLGTGVT